MGGHTCVPKDLRHEPCSCSRHACKTKLKQPAAQWRPLTRISWARGVRGKSFVHITCKHMIAKKRRREYENESWKNNLRQRWVSSKSTPFPYEKRAVHREQGLSSPKLCIQAVLPGWRWYCRLNSKCQGQCRCLRPESKIYMSRLSVLNDAD